MKLKGIIVIFLFILLFCSISYASSSLEEFQKFKFRGELFGQIKEKIENQKQQQKPSTEDFKIIFVITDEEDPYTASDLLNDKGPLKIISELAKGKKGTSYIRRFGYVTALNFSFDDIDLLAKITRHPNVKVVRENGYFYYAREDSIKIINSDDVNNMTVEGVNLTGKGQTICLVDGGVDYNHTELANYTILGRDYVSNDDDPMDEDGHGTHIAGIMHIVAPDAMIAAVRACNSGSCSFFDVQSAVQWCIDHQSEYNITAISLSIGGGGRYNDTFCPTFVDSQLKTARDNNMFITASSGNEGYSDGISYPGCSPYTVSVGSTTKSDTISWFTQTHPTSLDLLAPGSSIVSTKRGGGTSTKSGTSFSTPFVSASGVLLRQNYNLNNLSSNMSMIKDALVKTGKHIFRNNDSWPRIDVLAAIENVTCFKDSNCGPINYSSSYCMSNDVYRNATQPVCINPGFVDESVCSSTTKPLLFEDCIDTCTNGTCDPIACSDDSDCGTDFYSPAYCSSGNVYRNFTEFTCSNPGLAVSSCSNSTSETLNSTCTHGCDDGLCIACSLDSHCGEDIWKGHPYCDEDNLMQVKKEYACLDAGTANSSCSYTENIELKETCDSCSDGICKEIICFSDSDCGTDGYYEDRYCDGFNVMQDYREHNCINPGTVSSYCNHSESLMLRDSCSGSCVSGSCDDIVCYSDSDCGKDRYVGDRSCLGGDVWQDYREYTCLNAGTASSSCTYSDDNERKKDCEFGCSSGICLADNSSDYICSLDSDCGTDGYILDSYCSGTDVYQNYRDWTCRNHSTNDSYCAYKDTKQLKENCTSCLNGACVADSCSFSSDCGTSGYIGKPYCNGNNLMQVYRTFNCENPATIWSSCIHLDNIQIKKICTSCSDGICEEDLTGINDVELRYLVVNNNEFNKTIFSFDIKNTGNNTLNNVEWKLNPGNNVIIGGVVEELKSGEVRIITRWVDYGSLGTYYAYAEVDPANKIIEVDESNNKEEIIVKTI